MDHAYSSRRQAENAPPEKEAPEIQGPSMAALSSGAAQPTAEQMGHRVDLPDAMRTRMEEAFGADLSAVRLYESRAVADAGAKAIARGADIAFAPGLLDFTSFGGQALLGHEISHVVSQARGEVTGGGFLNDHALEARADAEGAMAASGQTVAMPTAALSPVTAAAAAGPMQAKDKDKDPRKEPGKISLSGSRVFKPGRTLAGETDADNKSASVLGVNAAGGSEAVIKMATDPGTERVLSQFYNTGGNALDTKHAGMWHLSAPGARAVSKKEEKDVRKAIASGKLREMDAPDPKLSPEEAIEHSLARTTVFSMAKGRSRLDRNDPAYDQKAQDPNALDSNPSDPRENADYQRALGYAAMLDMITGNGDRLTTYYAPHNWIEDREKRQIHLFDNDHQWSRGLSTAGESWSMEEWLSWFTHMVGEGGKGFGSATDFITGLTNKDSQKARVLSNDYSSLGAFQAVSDLPGMQDQLAAKFLDDNGGGKLNPIQSALLERMQIAHEYMTNPEMAEIYRGLSQIGLTKNDRETEETTATRKRLLAQRTALRNAPRRKRPLDLSLDPK